ncbi:MAG TPA: D-2-hydroxyacid dehydrogenase [Lacipirellulaceae bacterium]|nr:D-2-hydroxyacid dehydrogenase [Lacipirellulaceae bacterium]
MSLDNPSIVVLDAHCLNPGDLSWQRLEILGTCTFYERTSPEQLAERLREADIVLTNKVVLSRDLIAGLPRLKYIGVTATGYNIVDIHAAREFGVLVANVPTYGTTSVAQMVFAHLLNLTQHVAEHAQAVRDRRWAASPDFCFWDFPLLELDGMTMGIIGYGQIGRATAKLARAFGMHVLAFSRSPVAESDGIKAVDLQFVFRQSDVVSLHCPLTADTARLVNKERLALMKPTAFLINTSRGGLVDEAALTDALNSSRLAGAGLDVLDVEPPSVSNPLYSAKNCYITPHIAWATRSSRRRLLDAAVDNVADFLQGKPRNVVNI